MNFIENLSEKRQRWIESTKENNFEEGIKSLLTELYPENAHFVYELLQNAEDTQATKVTFILDSEGLVFQHNGKQTFTENDIESITGYGNSPKKGDIRKIGKFGVGFKAVFSYTNTPRVYSGQWAFEIHDLFCPREIEQIPEIAKGRNKKTYFRFPFNHPQKTKETAFEEIRKTIENLPPNTILFLQNIEEIRWYIKKDSEQTGFLKRAKMRKPNCYEIRKKSDKLEKTYWLRFTKEIPQKKGLLVAVAFRLITEKSKRSSKEAHYKIDSDVPKGDVSIFFPAEKETSNLKFYLNAPFAATVARDSIKNQSENLELRDLLVELFIESLAKIKKSGLLDHNFLAILPNDEDELPEFYEPFQDRIIEAFQNKNYTPTWNNNYLPAINLLQSANEIKKVINRKNILNRLVAKENIDWVIDADKGSRIYDFLKSLKIKEWSWRELLEKIGVLFSDKNVANEILAEFPDEWLKSFYVLLGVAKEESNYHWRHGKVKEANIVRLQDGTHTVGRSAYFQTELINNIKNLSIIKPEIYQSTKNKNQNEKAEKILRDLGVKEFEEKDEIKIILDKHYKDAPIDNGIEHIKHLRKFIAFLRKYPGEKSIFSGYDFLIIEENEDVISYYKPSQVFVDEPFEQTNLSVIESFLNKDSKWKLWSAYSSKIKNQKEFVQFLKEIGVNFNLKIKKCNISNNPDIVSLKQDLAKGTREVIYTSTNLDYYIENLDEMLQQKNRAVSHLVWKTMSEADRTVLLAKYRPNNSKKFNERTASSQLVHTLKQHAWIPDKEGNFYEPQEVTLEMLPDDFPIIKGNGWFSAIGMGTQTEKSKLTEQQKLERLARQLNLTVQELEKARQWAKMSQEERNEFEDFKQQKIKEKQNKSAEKQSKVTENEVSNSERESESNQNNETEASNETDSFELRNETDDSAQDYIDDEEFEQEIQKEEEANDEEENRIKNSNMSEVEKWQIVKSRSGQGIFRRNVKSIENQCRLTDLRYKKFLVASHIKSWKESSKEEKLDGNNGLLLSPHVDRLFDRGWISFTDNGEILCANDGVKEIMKIWGLDSSKSVGVFNDEQKKYLAYHRENIFKKSE